MDSKYLELRKIRKIFEYQFGLSFGKSFFPDEVDLTHSKKTKRIRHIYLNNRLLATLRPKDGYFSLTIEGGKRFSKIFRSLKHRVIVEEGVEKFISEGRNLFAKNVLSSDAQIKPKDEVIISDLYGQILAVGRSVLTGSEILAFERGIAVKVRKGSKRFNI
jgi:predicted RNA-binding protein (TIGR00451 family)